MTARAAQIMYSALYPERMQASFSGSSTASRSALGNVIHLIANAYRVAEIFAEALDDAL